MLQDLSNPHIGIDRPNNETVLSGLNSRFQHRQEILDRLDEHKCSNFLAPDPTLK